MAPFIERLLHERYGPRQVTNRMLRDARRLLRAAHAVPVYLGQTLEKLSADELKIQLEHRGLDHLITELDRSSNRIVIALVMSALIVASALIIRSGYQPLWLSVPIFLASSLLGLWLIYGVFRSGRL
jgi:ubiquinone biosynthesis protein